MNIQTIQRLLTDDSIELRFSQAPVLDVLQLFIGSAVSFEIDGETYGISTTLGAHRSRKLNAESMAANLAEQITRVVTETDALSDETNKIFNEVLEILSRKKWVIL